MSAKDKRKVKAKRPCCESKVRCKSCPVVLKRMELAGLAERRDKRNYVVAEVSKSDLKALRRRPVKTAKA